MWCPVRTLFCAAFLIAASGNAHAAPITLQNATATFSQVNLEASDTIDGSFSDTDNGWGISAGIPVGPETIVWETTTDINVASSLSFRMSFLNGHPQSILGRFRLSYTTDDRNIFADGLQSGGDVTANWNVLNVLTSATATDGMTLTLHPDNDGSILAGPSNAPDNSVFDVTFGIVESAITGFRLEAMEDLSIPASSGPGFGTNGNFVLVEFEAEADADSVPEPGSVGLLLVGVGGLALARRRHRKNRT